MDLSKGPTRLVEPGSIYAPNSSGFPALPDSVHRQILSHFPQYQIPDERSGWQHPDCQLRFWTLQSLTRTCRSLRKFYSKFLWDRIDVPIFGRVQWRLNERGLAVSLLGQLESVTIRQPQYAFSVRVLNVQFGTYSFKTLFDEFLRCLGLLPKLRVVQLQLMERASWNRPSKPLSCIPEDLSLDPRKPREPLTSIEEWFSTSNFLSIAAFCPNLRVLGGIPKQNTFDSVPHLFELIAYFRKHGPFTLVERLDEIQGSLINDFEISELVAIFPNVRKLGVWHGSLPHGHRLSETTFTQNKGLRAFPHLDEVKIEIPGGVARVRPRNAVQRRWWTRHWEEYFQERQELEKDGKQRRLFLYDEGAVYPFHTLTI